MEVNGEERAGGEGSETRTVVSDEIRASLVDHVLIHGLSMREAGQRVQPEPLHSYIYHLYIQK